MLEEKIGLLVVIVNDVNCVGLGEVWFGVGSYFKYMIMFIFGIGVGGVIILNN